MHALLHSVFPTLEQATTNPHLQPFPLSAPTLRLLRVLEENSSYVYGNYNALLLSNHLKCHLSFLVLSHQLYVNRVYVNFVYMLELPEGVLKRTTALVPPINSWVFLKMNCFLLEYS